MSQVCKIKHAHIHTQTHSCSCEADNCAPGENSFSFVVVADKLICCGH